jgi:hypothetical protein
VDPQRWQRARALFDRLVELPAASREALIAASGEDAALCDEVRALLDADARQQGATGLHANAPELLAALVDADARVAVTSQLGRRFGAWRIDALLAQGGMGAVYLAERVAGGFTQRAALKLVRPGLAAEELLTRFRHERQILAGLDHPNIARLLDGGAGPGGEPYLALEYVDGRDLRAHCDAARLDLPARLRLFLTVCDAVAHAHARLVVHRDLKPSNILVASDGTVKLLDFGVAKLLDPNHEREATVARLRLYTPQYAAPEQVRGEPATTAVDIYALGVVLFELLTGRRPYCNADASPTAIEQAVLNEEPVRPSGIVTRDGNSSAATPAITLAALRHATPTQLRRQLRGDLDQIVLKALRKRPQDRYASVRLLADDVQAWLERRPVDARRGGTRYRLLRFAQRHAVASGFALLALAGLVAGLGVALWQAREAQTQRDAARAEASKATAALGFMTGLFQLADPGESQGERITARELLARGAQRIRTELRDQPAARAELLRAMGDAHLGLGLYDAALPLLEEARGADDGDGAAALSHAITLQELGRYDDALAELETLRARLQAAPAPDTARIARVDLRIGMASQALNRLDAADAAYRRALDAQRALFGAQHEQTQDSTLRYVSLLVLRGEHERARDESAQVVAALRARQPRDDVKLARAIDALAMAVSNTGPLSEAEALRREQLELTTRVYGDDHPRTLSARNDLASVLYARLDYAGAEPLFTSVLAERRRQLGPDHPSVALAANNLANTLLALGRIDEVPPLAADALRIRIATYGESHHTTAASLRTLGMVELERGNPAAARALAERAVAAFEAALGAESRTMVGALNDLVRARLALDEPDADCAIARRAQAVSQAERAPERPEAQYQFALLGACRVALGERDGLVALRSALPILQADFGRDDRRSRVIERLLAESESRVKRSANGGEGAE